MKFSTLMIGAWLVCAPAFAQSGEMGLDLTDDTPPVPAKAPAKAAAVPAKAAVAPAAKAAPAKPADDVGLDLSSTAEVQAVLVAPPIIKVTTSQAGGFAGFNASKTVEKFDLAAHKRLVDAFQKQLDGKAIPAESAFAIVVKEGVTAVSIRTPAGASKLAKAANVPWVVVFEFNKTNGLVGTINNAEGAPVGTPVIVATATGITAKHAEEMAAGISKQLIELAKPKAAPVTTVVAVQEPVTPVVPAEEEQKDVELEKSLYPERNTETAAPRIVAAVGPGAAIRTFNITGADAERLAELRNSPVVGLAFYGQIAPLQFFKGTAGKRWADLEIEVNYRHAFVKAEGVGGGVTGQTCSMTDDDLQIRGTYRFKVVDHPYGPQVGVGGGWSREQTLFSCEIPLLSASYSGIDAQLRVKQPIYRDMISLDASFGPRILMGGGDTSSKALNLSGEAWLEARPISLFFARAGVRASHLNLSTPTLNATDTRIFAGAELGAFF